MYIMYAVNHKCTVVLHVVVAATQAAVRSPARQYSKAVDRPSDRQSVTRTPPRRTRTCTGILVLQYPSWFDRIDQLMPVPVRLLLDINVHVLQYTV